ncbi:dephospho-CoA kinase [Anaplasma capra]|uniref:dephospho-CoA kinase n=1 Tax=Anaplasma capra TaxID=1562740 RepID=UPI0021D5EFCC|nr:dephospho-CoA kinase [Anaplasma capra]MCU7611444.1 dephospho-CoA kinase [Anaplasma capra]MCU7612117.1 dephospho-CoA kinase [Anaplasma capra]
MVVLGLSGGVGSGKSTVAAMFARSCRAAVFDADKVVHDMYSNSAAIAGLVAEHFPDCVCDGNISREKLSKHFFSYGPLWRKFQSAVHSIVLEKQRRFILERGRAGYDCIVLDVPLLLEAGFWRCCDLILHIDVSQSLQWHRLSQRGLSEQEIKFLLSLQLPRERRRSLADFHINCGGRRGEVLKRVLQIVRGLDTSGQRGETAKRKLACVRGFK